MNRILSTLLAATLCACTNNMIVLPRPDQAQRVPGTVRYTAVAGRESRLNTVMSLNADCTSRGIPTIRVPSPPAHGTTSVRDGDYYPTFGPLTQRASCNLKPEPGAAVFYQPAEGYVGPDSLSMEIIYPDGQDHTINYDLTVK